MGTSESRPLELIYGEFRRKLEAGDVECAMDLMAMASLAATSTPAQTERCILRNLADRGMISTECADIRRNQDFETATLRFAVSAVSPLAGALPADVGASTTRRRGWIYAWQQLTSFHPDASNSEATSRYFRAVSDYLDDPSVGEATGGVACLAGDVEHEFEDYLGLLSMDSFRILAADPSMDGGEDGFENETRIIDEFESFLDGGETSEALNLLAVSWFCTQYFGLEGDGQAISELLAESASLTRDKWNDSTEIDDLLSRLWVTAHSELVELIEDETLENLELPGFEAELPPLSDAEQQILQSSLEEYEARQSGQVSEDDDDAASDDEVGDARDLNEADVDGLEDAGDPAASVVPRSPLVAAALRHLDRSCGAYSGSSVLSMPPTKYGLLTQP